MKTYGFTSIPKNLHSDELIHYITLGMIDPSQYTHALQKMIDHLYEDDSEYERGYDEGWDNGYEEGYQDKVDPYRNT